VYTRSDLLIVGESFLIVAFPVEILFVAAVGDRVRKYSEERQLLVKPGDALRSRVMKSTGPVVAKDVAERFRVAIEEILSHARTATEPISFRTKQAKQFGVNTRKFSRISVKDNSFYPPPAFLITRSA